MISVEGELVLEGASDINRMRRAAQFYINNSNVELLVQSENVAKSIVEDCWSILLNFASGECDESVRPEQLRHYFDDIHSMFAETIINFAATEHSDALVRSELSGMLATIYVSRDLDPEY